ncbi:MAG TPA: hypothetical protein VK709_20410 [Candidatus Saccharimonadales bacterium]|nr:hypothetical protein [Candidatus Saccharimonadales bacterium]
MTRIEKVIQNQTKTISEAIETAQATQNSPKPTVAEIHIPETVVTRKAPDDATDDKRYQKRTLVVASLTLLAVVIYAWLAYEQWQEMIAATGATIDAVHEARRSRQQNQNSFSATIEQFHLDQRAWVGPEMMIIKEMHAPDPINIDITIVNSGKTPALKMKVRYYLYVSDSIIDIEKTSKSILAMPKGESTVSTLFPNQTNHLIAPTSTTDELGIQSVKTGRKLLYFFAWISYDDVFKGHHETRFCSQFRPNGQVLSACDGQYDYAN